MKLNFSKIKNYFKKENDVLRDWKMVLIFFSIFLIVAFAADIYIFWKYQNELSQKATVENFKMMTVDRDSLQKVVDELKIKEANFQENLTAPKIEDPSL